MSKKILVLPGDGIGIEIVAEAVKILDALRAAGDFDCEYEQALIGGAAVDAHGVPLPQMTKKVRRLSSLIRSLPSVALYPIPTFRTFVTLGTMMVKSPRSWGTLP